MKSNKRHRSPPLFSVSQEPKSPSSPGRTFSQPFGRDFSESSPAKRPKPPSSRQNFLQTNSFASSFPPESTSTSSGSRDRTLSPLQIPVAPAPPNPIAVSSLNQLPETQQTSQSQPHRYRRLKIAIPTESDLPIVPFTPSSLPARTVISKIPLASPVIGPESFIVTDDSGRGHRGDDPLGRFCVSVARGRRGKMEDTFAAVPLLDPDNDDSLGFYGIFDGHGKAGKRCSSIVAEQLTASISLFFKQNMKNASRPNVKKSLQDAYATADAECLKQIEEGGSTAVVAIVGGGDNGLFVANVGDSRAVLSRNGKAVDLSLDQKPDRVDERARIEAAGGRVVFYSGWRVEGTLNVSRSMGDKVLKRFVPGKPEIVEREIGPDDEFLILASDGVWAVLSSQQAVDLVHRALAASSAGLFVPDLEFPEPPPVPSPFSRALPPAASPPGKAPLLSSRGSHFSRRSPGPSLLPFAPQSSRVVSNKSHRDGPSPSSLRLRDNQPGPDEEDDDQDDLSAVIDLKRGFDESGNESSASKEGSSVHSTPASAASLNKNFSFAPEHRSPTAEGTEGVEPSTPPLKSRSNVDPASAFANALSANATCMCGRGSSCVCGGGGGRFSSWWRLQQERRMKASEVVVQAALDARSMDNVSCVVVFLSSYYRGPSAPAGYPQT